MATSAVGCMQYLWLLYHADLVINVCVCTYIHMYRLHCNSTCTYVRMFIWIRRIPVVCLAVSSYSGLLISVRWFAFVRDCPPLSHWQYQRVTQWHELPSLHCGTSPLTSSTRPSLVRTYVCTYVVCTVSGVFSACKSNLCYMRGLALVLQPKVKVILCTFHLLYVRTYVRMYNLLWQ